MTEPVAIPRTPLPIFACNVKTARRSLRMSQTQLGELVGVPASRICDWEKGKHEPRPATRDRLAEALEVPVWWLYRDHSLDDEPDEQAA